MEIAITTAAFFCLLVFFVVLAIASALKAREMERGRNNNINNQNTDKTMNKKKKYIANAFSLQMLANSQAVLIVTEISEADFKALTADAVSAVGHPDTANVLGVECNRMNVTLSEGDTLYVAQLVGGRLPEGATTLPEGFTFKYYRVKL